MPAPDEARTEDAALLAVLTLAVESLDAAQARLTDARALAVDRPALRHVLGVRGAALREEQARLARLLAMVR